MRLKLVAVGRLRAGPELALIDTYLDRARKVGPGLGVSDVALVEVEAKKPGADAEAQLLMQHIPAAAVSIVLDERGRDLTSEDLAAMIGRFRDDGVGEIVFAIGGADGHGEAMRVRADRLVAFGRATWPHMLVRVMLAEQIYRSFTILANHPYHRGA